MICAIVFPFAQFSHAQTSAWEPGVSKDWFKDDVFPKGEKNPKKQKPTHRLAKTDCDDCQKIVDQLQNALDDWYALELAEADQIISDSVQGKDTPITQKVAREQREDAMAGLGQKQRAPPKGKTKADVQKEIKRLSDALTECLKKCEPTPTPTPTPEETTPTPVPEEPPALPNPITLPTPPPCFDTEAQREAFLSKWDPIASNERNQARKAREIVNLKYKNDNSAWGVYWKKKQEIHEKSADDLQKIIDDAADPKKTPVPCPKRTATGGGGTSKPTPTPKGKPKRERTTTGHNVSFDDGGAGLSEDFCALISENKIRIDDTIGTGETIGHVADLVIENLTDQPIEVTIPPMVLESRSRKNQHYGSRGGDTVEVPPHSKKKVPLDGICLARNKPPVGKDVGGDLAINDCDPNVHISHDDAHRMMRIAESKYEAADKLEEEGKLKDMPYRDPKKRKEIVEQWSTWADPRISEVTGAPPATKDDFKKVVYKQAEEQGPVTPDKKKKLDDGIDTLWDKIELTTKKAKDLEKQPTEEEATPAMPAGTGENVSDNTPTPVPQTQEKKKKEGKNKKKKWPKPIQDWLDKKKVSEDAQMAWNKARSTYWDKVWEYGKKLGPHTQDLIDKANAAKKKANEPGATQADQAAAEQAAKELDKQLKELEKDYQKTPEGKGEFDKLHEAETAKDKAYEAEKAAEKALPPGVDKDAVQREEDLRKPVQGVW